MDYSDYNEKWFKKVSKEDLDIEREKVRVAFGKAGKDPALAGQLQNLLRRFDDELRKRSDNGKPGDEFPAHREHGWYLPNDD